MTTITVRDVTFGNALPFVFVGGPCQIESRDHALMIATRLAADARAAGVPFVFKASYDKANRTSVAGQRGIGMDEGLRVLEDVRDALGCPVLTDVHAVDQVDSVAQAVDIIQIPAFLSRQTDLLLAAGATRQGLNNKNSQFLAPWDMAAVAAKIASTGNDKIILCDRGASFGYNTLVSDMRALPIMAATGYPVMYDATHSVQAPGAGGQSSGGVAAVLRRSGGPRADRARGGGCGCSGGVRRGARRPRQRPLGRPDHAPARLGRAAAGKTRRDRRGGKGVGDASRRPRRPGSGPHVPGDDRRRCRRRNRHVPKGTGTQSSSTRKREARRAVAGNDQHEALRFVEALLPRRPPRARAAARNCGRRPTTARPRPAPAPNASRRTSPDSPLPP
jgi:2-dehydro-3-deoxyphosphooctonate aldolase (KDO 8-P synthase)